MKLYTIALSPQSIFQNIAVKIEIDAKTRIDLMLKSFFSRHISSVTSAFF